MNALQHLRDQAGQARGMAEWHRKSAAEYDIKADRMQACADEMEALQSGKMINIPVYKTRELSPARREQ